MDIIWPLCPQCHIASHDTSVDDEATHSKYTMHEVQLGVVRWKCNVNPTILVEYNLVDLIIWMATCMTRVTTFNSTSDIRTDCI